MPRPTARWATATSRAGAAALALFVVALVAPSLVGATIASGERQVFVPVVPTRVLDTRNGTGGVPVAKVGAGATLEFTVRGVPPVSAAAAAVTLNITVTGGTASSDVRVYAGGTAVPGASTINFAAGETVANGVSVKIGSNGKVAVRNASGQVHVIADVAGYYEDHNHDDRYYSKGQVDSKLAATGYVGSVQLADGGVANADLANGSVGGSKVANGSLGLTDVSTTVATTMTVTTAALIDPGQCIRLGTVVVPGTAPAVGTLILPTLTGTSLSSVTLQALPVVVAVGFGSTIPVTLCNVSNDGNTRVFGPGSSPVSLTVID